MHRRLALVEPVSRAAIWSRLLAWFGLGMLGLGVLVFRQGDPSLARLAPLAAAYAIVLTALVCALVAFRGIWRHGERGLGRAVQGFALALLLCVPPACAGLLLAMRPALTDVSTDLVEPPSFSRSQAALRARGGYVPPELAAERRAAQRKAYPKVLPILLELPPELAFDLARRAVALRGWQVIEAARPGGRSGAGRIEALASLPVLKLPGDLTIRIRPRTDGSRIDIRAATRLPGHDLGLNAARIADFAAAIELLLEAR